MEKLLAQFLKNTREEPLAFLVRRIIENAEFVSSIIESLPKDAPPSPAELLAIRQTLVWTIAYAKAIEERGI